MKNSIASKVIKFFGLHKKLHALYLLSLLSEISVTDGRTDGLILKVQSSFKKGDVGCAKIPQRFEFDGL